MFSLDELLGQHQSNQALGQISQAIGAEPSVTNSAIQMALPMILGSLGNQAQTQPSAFGTIVNMATGNSGSILGDVAGYLTGAATQQPAATQDASGILGSIFGDKQGAATQHISNNTGLGMGQVAQILMMLAPMVMGYLGRQQTQGNLDSGGLASLITGQQQQAMSSGNPMMDLASSFLDSNHDGSAMDDIASMAMNYMTNR